MAIKLTFRCCAFAVMCSVCAFSCYVQLTVLLLFYSCSELINRFCVLNTTMALLIVEQLLRVKLYHVDVVVSQAFYRVFC